MVLCAGYTLFHAVQGVDNFPNLEIVGCPARYDRLNETYVVDFQWRVPFSPAALSHVYRFSLDAHRLLRLHDDVNDFILLLPGVISDSETINVSHAHKLSNSVLYNVFCGMVNQ